MVMMSCLVSQAEEDLELEMLAPYISMDNDYQLQTRTHADHLDSVQKITRTPTNPPETQQR